MFPPPSEDDYNFDDCIPMPVFSEGRLNYNQDEVVTSQPIVMNRQDERDQMGTRRPIPVSTIDWQSSMTSHFSPLHGLDFLADVTQIIVQQTVELTDLMSTVASENRYTVKVPRGETIYYATESSTSFQRTCFGSSRAFSMRLYDPTQQEAIHFKRQLGCGSCCSFFCFLQEMEVWTPPGDLVGRIVQDFNLTRPSFSVYSTESGLIYRIEGPDAIFGCMLGKNYNFQIFSGDGATQLGSIVHQWDQVQVAYNLSLQIPANERSSRRKALLLGAAFLLEYMYFESSKKRSSCKCMC